MNEFSLTSFLHINNSLTSDSVGLPTCAKTITNKLVTRMYEIGKMCHII